MASLNTHGARLIGERIVFPAALYFLAFAALTYPLIGSFSTHFFADAGDGLQNVWNLWWVNLAVTRLHQWPWHTTYVHWPYGTSLIGHTLAPLNGLLCIPLLHWLTLVEAHNCVVLFSFVAGGLTAFWLADHLTRSFWPSWIGGCIFTFSNYHFAHAEGHLQLVSLEWIPAFLLCWHVLLVRPGVRMALLAALTLLAVALCDYYYLCSSVLAAGLMAFWEAGVQRNAWFWLERRYRLPLATVAVAAMLTTGLLVIALLHTQAHDPLQGAHAARTNSLDLLAPFIYGGHWRFAALTHGYWSRLPGNINETSVHLGWSVLGLLLYVWWDRPNVRAAGVTLWYGMLLCFFLLALGPALQVWGREIPWLPPLPYAWCERLVPPLRLAGCPVRLMVMVTLSASVLCAVGLQRLFGCSTTTRVAASCLLLLLVVEYLPRPLPMTRPAVPAHVRLLKGLPQGAVLDAATPALTLPLYYQTVHEHPMAYGFLARLSASVAANDAALDDAVRRGDNALLRHHYRIKYLVTRRRASGTQDHPASTGLVYENGAVRVYDLAAGDGI